MKVSLSCFIVRRDGWWNWLVGTITRAHHHHQRALFGHAKTSYFIYYFARVFIYSLLAWDMMVLAIISVFLKRSLMVANCNRRSFLRRSAPDLFVLLEMHFATAPDPRWGFLQLQLRIHPKRDCSIMGQDTHYASDVREKYISDVVSCHSRRRRNRLREPPNQL